MPNNSEISYFKIGIFVLAGIGLIITALLVFGSEKMFEPVVHVETYFEESIQGISDGSPVKYRGLQIGYVEDIGFTSELYGNGKDEDEKMYSRSIFVKIAITSKLFTELSSIDVRRFLTKEVGEGLRAKLVAQGLTGIYHLEFDYVNPKEYPITKLSWTPKSFYIPSVTSTLTTLSESAQDIMHELKGVNFKKLFANLNSLIFSLNEVANKSDNLLSQIDNPTIRTMQNLKIVSENLNRITERLKLKPSEIIFSSYPPPINPNKL